MSPRLGLIVLASLILQSCAPSDSARHSGTEQRVATILIGIDGMRWDYPERFGMRAFSELGERGIRADGLLPIFPTKTFPNFYSLATGLFANHSGIIDNTMYDPDLDARFRMGDTAAVRDSRWWEGEPVWTTAEKNGVAAAVYFWPGSEAKIGGYRPSFWKAYDGSVPGSARIDQALEWLSMPAMERPDLVLLYFSLVDDASHRYGTDADETRLAALEADGLIRSLLSGLKKRNMINDVNIMIVSDHGMSARSQDQVIFLDDYVNLNVSGVVSMGQFVTLWPKPEAVDSVYLALAGAHKELQVYKRDNLPSRFHLSGHRRTPPIVAVPSPGWTVSTREQAERRPDSFSGGAHGYDNSEPDMQGVFAAAGPSFRSAVHIDSIRAVDVYNLVVYSLGLDPAPNDGDLSILPRLMIQP